MTEVLHWSYMFISHHSSSKQTERSQVPNSEYQIHSESLSSTKFIMKSHRHQQHDLSLEHATWTVPRDAAVISDPLPDVKMSGVMSVKNCPVLRGCMAKFRATQLRIAVLPKPHAGPGHGHWALAGQVAAAVQL